MMWSDCSGASQSRSISLCATMSLRSARRERWPVSWEINYSHQCRVFLFLFAHSFYSVPWGLLSSRGHPRPSTASHTDSRRLGLLRTLCTGGLLVPSGHAGCDTINSETALFDCATPGPQLVMTFGLQPCRLPFEMVKHNSARRNLFTRFLCAWTAKCPVVRTNDNIFSNCYRGFPYIDLQVRM